MLWALRCSLPSSHPTHQVFVSLSKGTSRAFGTLASATHDRPFSNCLGVPVSSLPGSQESWPPPPLPSDPAVQAPSPFSLRPRGPGSQLLLPCTQGSRLPAPPPSDPGVQAPSPSSLEPKSPGPQPQHCHPLSPPSPFRFLGPAPDFGSPAPHLCSLGNPASKQPELARPQLSQNS